MTFEELVKARKSIRNFEDRELTNDMITSLLEAARWAPSGGNCQPWHFVVVQSKHLKQQLAVEACGQRWMDSAPVIIVICTEVERSAEIYGDRGRYLYCLQDTAAAVQNIMLSARYQGLGTCWVGAFNEQKCSELLELSKKLRPVAMIPVGYPAQDPSPRPRRPLDEIVTYM